MNQWEWQLLEDKNPVDHLLIAGVEVRAGDRVRLKPRQGGDVMDLALAGQIATIEAIEQDYEGRQHICVVVDHDPGRDLGLMRQPGHRFFFDPSEVEPMPKNAGAPPQAVQKSRVLIAGIGNIFLGDDAFGVEVIKRLGTRQLPSDVRIVDFGIRGLDLVYALQDGYETVILVDACPQGKTPGTVFVIQPDLTEDGSQEAPIVEAHAMNPNNVIRLAKAMDAPLQRLLLVGCEPETLGGPDGHMGLSAQVEAVLDKAVDVIEKVVSRILDGSWEDRCQQQAGTLNLKDEQQQE